MLTRDELLQLDKQMLVEIILQLQTQIQTLTQRVANALGASFPQA